MGSPGWWKDSRRNTRLWRCPIPQTREQEAAYKQFCADSAKNIADVKVELAKWEAMKPVEEMNLEEALDAGLIGTTIKGIPHPDVPSFWPHDETWEEYMVRLKNAEDDGH